MEFKQVVGRRRSMTAQGWPLATARQRFTSCSERLSLSMGRTPTLTCTPALFLRLGLATGSHSGIKAAKRGFVTRMAGRLALSSTVGQRGQTEVQEPTRRARRHEKRRLGCRPPSPSAFGP